MADSAAVKRAQNRIVAVGKILDVPSSTSSTAKTIFERFRKEVDYEGYPADQMAAASFVLASRSASLPVTVADVTDAWSEVATDPTGNFEEREVARKIETVSEASGVSAPPVDPTDLTERYAEELDVPSEVAATADRLLDQLMAEAPQVLTRGTSPSGNAAGALYLAAKQNGVRTEFTQSVIGSVADVSKMTIRKRYQEMEEALEGQENPQDREDDETAIARNSSTDGRVQERESDTGVDEGTPGDGGRQASGETDDGVKERESDGTTTFDVGLPAYLALRSEASEREVEESELLVQAVHRSLKELLNGSETRRVPVDETVPVEVELPKQVRMVLKSVEEDPEYGIESTDEFTTGAVLDAYGNGEYETGISTIELPATVHQSGKRLVDENEEYDSIAELLHDSARKMVIE